MPSTGPTSGRQSAVTVASESNVIPSRRAHTCSAVSLRSALMTSRRWRPAAASLASSSACSRAMSSGVSCMYESLAHQRAAQELADRFGLGEKAVVAVDRGDHLDVGAAGQQFGDLVLQTEWIETIGTDAGHEHI